MMPLVFSDFRLSKKKKIDALILCLYLALSIFLILLFQPNKIIGTVVLFGIPGLYLMMRYWRIHSHAFLLSIGGAIFTGFSLEVVAKLNSVWTYQPVLPYASLNSIPLEAMGWYVLWIGFTVTLYQVFFNKNSPALPKKRHILKAHRTFVLLVGAVFTGTLFLACTDPHFFMMPEAYVICASILIYIPVLVLLYIHPHILRQVIKAAMFLSLFALMYEIIGLHLGWWEYPGHYIAQISLSGISIPVEELVLWVLLASFAFITFFEELEIADRKLLRQTRRISTSRSSR